MHRVTAAAAAIVLTMGLAACDGGSDPASHGSTAAEAMPGGARTTAPGATPPTAALPTVAVGSAAATTVAGGPPTSAAPPSTPGTNTPDTSVAADSEWCRLAAELHYLTTQFRQLSADDTDAVRGLLREILQRLAAIEPVSPPQLAVDVPVSADAFRLLDRALAEVDYDLGAADLTVLDARQAEIAAANARIRAFNRDACGLDLGVTDSEPP